MKFFISFSFLFIVAFSYSQSLSINTDGSTANLSSMLDIKSTTQGLLIPRMTKLQRNAITSPAKGLLVFINDADSTGFHYYDGSGWLWLESIGKAGWKITGNSGTDTAINFIGTTNTMPLRFKQNNQWLGQFNLNKGNYFIGKDAGKKNTAIGIIAVGDSALSKNTNSVDNIAIGYRALRDNVTGDNNTAFGSNALSMSNDVLGANTAIGSYALSKSVNGSGSTAVGTGALANDESTGSNTAIGYAAMLSNSTGFGNVAVGNNVMNYSQTGRFNVAIGNNAMNLADKASYNVAIGLDVLRNDTSGFNTSVGAGSMQVNKRGVRNTALGYFALTLNSTGMSNTALGAFSLINNNTGSKVVAVGDSAGYQNLAGSSNVYIGYAAGIHNINGSSNTIIGSDADVLNINFSNATAIGANAAVGQSNSMVLGSISGINGATASTNVGIGTTMPQYPLHVVNDNDQDGGWEQGIMIENSSALANVGEAAVSFKNTAIPANKQWSIGMNQNPNLSFNYGSTFAGGTIRMVIDSLGNVGIGTLTPAALFDVDGTAKLGTNGTALSEIIKVTVNKDVVSIPANDAVTETFSVTNASLNSTVYISPAGSLPDGIVISYARISGPGIVEVKFANITGASINPNGMNYFITVIR